MRSWDAFQENRGFVLEELRRGELDYLEVVSRVEETKFFRYMLEGGDLERLAATYPDPRQKEEVPLWVYLASQLTLKLHGAPGFSSLPYIIHCGGLRDALEAGQVTHRLDPASGDSTFEFRGYNCKNTYARRTPCDQDFLRKLAAKTDAVQLEEWYGTAVASYLAERGAYDPEGIFMLDGSYLFVPDNAGYEGSKVCYFDEHNHPISRQQEPKLSKAEQKRCRFRRYYRVVGLSHTNRQSDYLFYSGARMIREGGETDQIVPLVSQFVDAVGKGVMKLLLIDRGFIDGVSLGRVKEEFGVDWIVPLKAKMDITAEAWSLAELDPGPWEVWEPPPRRPPPAPPQRPEHIRAREKKRRETVQQKTRAEGIAEKPRLVRVEFKLIRRIEIWKDCPVPLDVLVMREYTSDGECSQWGLMTTLQVEDPMEIRDLYRLRSSCEEGWRQTKCYWDLSGFRSTKFSLVVNQIIFVLLAYSLLQLFLLKSDRRELAKATRKRLLAELLPEGERVAVYRENHVGYFSVVEYSQILLHLEEGPRRRLAGTIKRLRKSQLEPPGLPERPTP